MPLGKPYKGFQKKLIIAFDVGTTFSGVSYAVLIPEEQPSIQGVTKFPGQHKVGGDCKIPSVVCYDETGNVVAIGSETDPETNPELAEVEGLVRAEWFKLHLRPPHLAAEQGFDIDDVPALPQNKTAIDIFSDLLRYLYQCAEEHIRQQQGNDMWESFHDNIDFVLSHPNGWEGKQQYEMRQAVIAARLVANESEVSKRVSFVTEGEASLHFCLNKIPDALEKYANDGILVADCGGGTIDVSAYARSSGRQFKEIAPAECLLQGSIFVNRRAQAFLTDKLHGSKFGTPEDIDVMTRYFDKTTKPSFKGPSRSSFVRFGSLRENDPQLDIRNGNVKIDGAQIAKFFEPAVQGIIKVIEGQFKKTTKTIKTIVMVGGFSTSDYLFSQLENHFKTKGISILRPDAYLNKAVAEGAILFTLDHSVSSRIAKYTYGIESCTPYDPKRADHRARERTSFKARSGELMMPKSFLAILEKDTEVSEEKEFKVTYYNEYTRSQFRDLENESVQIKCYRNRSKKPPAFIDMEPELFPDLCEVTANVFKMKKSIRSQVSRRTGDRFWVVEYDVILLFGGTELKAQIAWMEKGVEKRGPASIVYDITPTANI